MVYQFTSGLNNRSSLTHNLQPYLFQDVLLWAEYQLLTLPEFASCGGMQSLLRAGMLAFMTTWINYSGRASYDFLANQLRNLLLSIPEHSSALLLWTLFVGAISVFTIDDRLWLLPKLSRTLRKLALEDWDAVRKHLESQPWVHFIHDKRAQEVWEQARAYHVGSRYLERQSSHRRHSKHSTETVVVLGGSAIGLATIIPERNSGGEAPLRFSSGAELFR